MPNEPVNKSLRKLLTDVEIITPYYLSSSLPNDSVAHDCSLSNIIQNGSFTGNQVTIGTDESLFRQFHANIEASDTMHLLDTNGDGIGDTSVGVPQVFETPGCTPQTQCPDYFHYHALHVNIHTGADSGHGTRWYSHMARPQMFDWAEAATYGGWLDIDILDTPNNEASCSVNFVASIAANASSTTDLGIISMQYLSYYNDDSDFANDSTYQFSMVSHHYGGGGGIE